MERLTRTAEVFDYCRDFCTAKCAYTEGQIREKCLDAILYEKLRDYEDTGLEPEEIGEWIKAEAEGRIVGWIPVTERLPPEVEEINEPARWSEKVIFWQMGGELRIGWYSYAFNVWSVSGNILTIRADFVTHWMPLPEPPEEPMDEQEPRFQ